ncbi:MAG: PadR family transcriptional regulator, partial [Solirubrobacteraceae bacterium]
REEIVDSRLRRYYRLTAGGSATLATEAERLSAHVRTALSRLRLSEGMPT